MPAKTPPAPAVQIVVCVLGFSRDFPDRRAPLIAATGERFPIDHELVRLAPERFVPFGTPQREIGLRRAELHEAHARRNAELHARAVAAEAKKAKAATRTAWFVDRDRDNPGPDAAYIARQIAPHPVLPMVRHSWESDGDDAA